MYAFASDSKQIYNVLANDFSKIQNFITSFAKESKDVINYYREIKFDLASQRNDYFAPAKNTQFSNNNKLINLLYTLGVLEDKSHISEIDWHCLKLHIYGNTINNISNTLDLPKITIEKAIHRLKSKIKVKNIEKILDYSS
ncbi:MAG: hypothetical protein HRT87_12805 [Legionellales bacterium]|nr:hypothetical protein [Legionellales bacterium]